MAKYIGLFFLILIVLTVVGGLVLSLFSIDQATITRISRFIGYFIIIVASIIVAFLFTNKEKREPSNKEFVIYTVSLMIVLAIIIVALKIYAGGSITSNDIGFIIASALRSILITSLPFYIFSKAFAKKYK